jgi:large subunit ribosomal protein L4
MARIAVRTTAGADAGTVEVDDAWFGIEPNVPVMHQVVTAQLAARRSGTQSTKTRAEVAGGGAKPWKQKGTGRARQGSIRAPHWRGGGVALGPKPRSYAQRTPKKMINLALRSALSDRQAEGKVIVVDEWAFEVPKTREAAAALATLGTDGRVLVVVPRTDQAAQKSFRNLPSVHVIDPGQLNAYDVLVSDWVVFARSTLPGTELPDRTATQATPAEQPQALAMVEAPERSLGADWEDEMSSDLPKRERHERDANAKPVDARDRVKSAGDKEDPKFAAARARTEREAELRARAATTKKDDGTAEAPLPEATDETPRTAAPERQSRRRGFSFNQTDEEVEG